MTVCLCMIVRNEAPVIARCLNSVRDLVDAWLIVDTGSGDGTQDLVRGLMRDLPGALIERPWRDFSTNRNEALDEARLLGDYVLFLDADDTLVLEPDTRFGDLAGDAFDVPVLADGITYTGLLLVRAALPWRWRGVLHEFLHCAVPHRRSVLPGVRIRRHHDGARRRAADTYGADALTLEAALQGEDDPLLRARYTFYLAQSYRDAGNKRAALTHYLARADLGFWDEEVFVSLLYAGRLMEQTGHSVEATLAIYAKATTACPRRAEALYAASRLCLLAGLHPQGYDFARRGAAVKQPAQGLFLELAPYDHGLLDMVAVHADRIGLQRECLEACLALLRSDRLPATETARVAANAQAALGKMPRQSDLGRAGRDGFLDQHMLRPATHGDAAFTTFPRVLVAILAKQKEEALPLYLECIERLDYPKSAIVLSIRTNNNTDATEAILRKWIARVGVQYAAAMIDSAEVPEPVEQYGVHEWNALRFRVMGRLRNASLRQTTAHACQFYFTADVDNFVRPETLRELVSLNLPIVSPFLRSISDQHIFSNYHAEVTNAGYHQDSAQYHWILNRWVRGVIEVPLVHCTYLVRADAIDALTYDDGSGRYEYVIFADSARKAGIRQFLDNRMVYGYITFAAGGIIAFPDGIARSRTLLAAARSVGD